MIERRYTDAQRAALLTRLTDAQTAEGLSHAQMSAVLGVSRATWSKVHKGRYSGDVDRVLAAGERWLAEREARSETPLAEYVETRISLRILAVCRRAWRMPSIGLIVTRSGCGKTMALREFARQLGSKALLVEGGEATATKRDLIVELADRLGVPIGGRSYTPSLYREVRRRLAALYAGGRAAPVAILVDEATMMRPAALNLLRALHDDPTCRTPIVLAGTWRLHEDLHRRHGLPGGYEQLRSRAGAQYLMRADETIADGDVKLVADAVLAAIGHRRKLSADAVRYLCRLAQRDGGLRNVCQRLQAVADLAEAACLSGRQAGRAPTFAVAELDAAAPLVGHDMDSPEVPNPFVTSTDTETAGSQDRRAAERDGARSAAPAA